MKMTKHDQRALMAEQKAETLVKNAKNIEKYRKDFEENAQKDCDLMTDSITIHFCETTKEKQMWAVFLHLTSSLPYRGFVGRRRQFFVKCGDVIIGMVQMASPLAQSRPRDQYLGFKDAKEKYASTFDMKPSHCFERTTDILQGMQARVIYSDPKEFFLVANRFDRSYRLCIDTTQVGMLITPMEKNKIRLEVTSGDYDLAKFVSGELFGKL